MVEQLQDTSVWLVNAQHHRKSPVTPTRKVSDCLAMNEIRCGEGIVHMVWVMASVQLDAASTAQHCLCTFRLSNTQHPSILTTLCRILKNRYQVYSDRHINVVRCFTQYLTLMTSYAAVPSRPLVGSSRKAKACLTTSSCPTLVLLFSPPDNPRFRIVPTTLSPTFLKPNPWITLNFRDIFFACRIDEWRGERAVYREQAMLAALWNFRT